MADVLETLAMPLGTAMLSALLALAALALRRRRVAAGLAVFALLWIWFWSAPGLAGFAVELLREPQPLPPIEELPAADAIVVLCGSAAPPKPERPYALLGSTADRVLHAARLHYADKAPTVITSGRHRRHQGPETCAESMRQWLVALGVPAEAVHAEERSENTRENAVFTAELAASLGIESVLLVTSNSHMARAHAAFAKTALHTVPAPLNEPWRRTNTTLVPQEWTLGTSSNVIREWIGRLVYRLRGWT